MSCRYELDMNILRTFLFSCAAIGCCTAQEELHKYRLPIEVFPLSYALKLQPFIPEGYFKGEIFIKINVTSPVDALYLHGSHLNISEVKLVGDLDNVLVKLQEEFELIKVYRANGEKFLDGICLLYFKYEGTLLHADQMGLVKGMYSYKNGTEVLVVTDFQPTYARRAYPCFDEPALKASFNFTIITPDPSWRALANTEEISREETQEGVIYKFKSTPPMSTDVTSFAITKMDFIENDYENEKRSLKVRTFLGDAKEENQTFVLNFAYESVKYFEEFTGIGYPMSKIDFLEYDKKFTATEYWGLTTFNRGLLHPTLDLYDSRQISIVVAHELTHYWFGNLVSNKWWSDIWLQEGFAQYLSHKVVDELFNTTNVEEYPLDYTYDVFKVDRESQVVNPVVTNCTTPKEIMLLFNDITYIKAGSIIRLLDFLTGAEGFKKIIQKYFQEFSFGSANTEDFVKVVEEVIPDKNLREFLETWLLQNRYPMVSIEEDLDNNQYVLRQQSASMYKETDNMSPFGYKWTIPIIYTTEFNKEPTTVWFRKEDEYLTIPKGKESFIKLNYNFMGIYYTNYTQKMWSNLIDNIQILSDIEQAQLILEAEKLFEADIINCDFSLRMISRVSSECNQYNSVSPLSVLYNLKSTLKFDPTAINLLRKFYYSVRLRSKLSRKNEEDTRNLIKKVRRSIFSEATKDDLERTIMDTPVDKFSKAEEIPAEKPHPRSIRCARWIRENLAQL